jgi:single-stranded DNA-binding protein
MNDLNSIILEAAVTGKPAWIRTLASEIERLNTGSGGEAIPDICEFDVLSIRETLGEKEDLHCRIRATGKQAEICQEHLEDGRCIRIVGRLKEDSGKLLIVAEHIEFRPRRKA